MLNAFLKVEADAGTADGVGVTGCTNDNLSTISASTAPLDNLLVR
jgi:hypothetical protein